MNPMPAAVAVEHDPDRSPLADRFAAVRARTPALAEPLSAEVQCRSHRNFLPPAARWLFSGLRLARDGA